MTLERALARIEADGRAIMADMGRLLGVDTSLPPGAGYGAFTDLLAGMLEPMGFACRRVVVPDPLWRSDALGFTGERVNLIAARRTGKEPFSIYFHIDTVPPGPGWSFDPFAASARNGYIYGRGAADMKGTIASVLAALRAIDTSDLALRYDPILLFCTDEEGGVYPGIRHLAEEGLIEGHLLCLNGSAAPRIWAGCFGSIDFHIRVLGRSAHSGNPVPAVNAFEESLPLLAALKALKDRVETRVSAMPPPPWLDGRPLRARLTLAMAHCAHVPSAVPGEFELVVNRRYGPEEAFDTVVDEFRRTVDEALAGGGALGWETGVAAHSPPVADPRGPHWPRWRDAVAAGFGFREDEFVYYGASSSSDMGWVQRCGRSEILLGGLSRPEAHVHAADERTTLRDLQALARAVLTYLSDGFEPNGDPARASALVGVSAPQP